MSLADLIRFGPGGSPAAPAAVQAQARGPATPSGEACAPLEDADRALLGVLVRRLGLADPAEVAAVEAHAAAWLMLATDEDQRAAERPAIEDDDRRPCTECHQLDRRGNWCRGWKQAGFHRPVQAPVDGPPWRCAGFADRPVPFVFNKARSP